MTGTTTAIEIETGAETIAIMTITMMITVIMIITKINF